MGERWIAEAEDLKPVGSSGVMEGGTPRVTLHVTVSKSGTFDAMHGVLTRAEAEPHILYDPATDRMGQYFPLDRSARALLNDGAKRTNGHGTVNIQIEVCAMPTPGFTESWTPGPNWRALLRAIRSWGVPDVWPAGRLSRTSGDAVDRSWTSYRKAGWFGHCNVPGNDHWDPGPIDQQAVFALEDDMPLTDQEIQRLWTGLASVKNPLTADPDDRVAPSYLLEYAALTSRDNAAAIKALAAKVDALAAKVSTASAPAPVVTQAQLEAALRVVMGSVDGK